VSGGSASLGVYVRPVQRAAVAATRLGVPNAVLGLWRYCAEVLSPRVPDLSTLELLISVAETGSLGRAAEAAGTSQQAVSARLKRAERAMGVTLLDRGARGTGLTREGVLLVAWARDVLGAAQVLDAGISSLRSEQEARVRVAASLTVAEYLLPGWLVRLAATHPQTAVSLDAVNSAEVASRVLARTADLGFVEGPDLPNGLEELVIGHDRLRVVVAPEHAWARRRRGLSAAELVAARLVQREPTSGTRQALESALREAIPDGPAMAPPLLELASTSAVRSAALTGAGPAVLSGLAVAGELRAGRLVEVKVIGVDLRRHLRAIWPAGSRPGGPARDLLSIAEQSRARPQS